MSKNFKLGDLVWAKMKYSPPWPAVIVKQPPKAKSAKGRKTRGHWVKFFGSDSHAWIPAKDISEHGEKLIQEHGNKKINSQFKTAVKTIIEESIKVEEELDKKLEKVGGCVKSGKAPKLQRDNKKAVAKRTQNKSSPKPKCPKCTKHKGVEPQCGLETVSSTESASRHEHENQGPLSHALPNGVAHSLATGRYTYYARRISEGMLVGCHDLPLVMPRGCVQRPETASWGYVQLPETAPPNCVLYPETAPRECVQHPETALQEYVQRPETPSQEYAQLLQTLPREYAQRTETALQEYVQNSETPPLQAVPCPEFLPLEDVRRPENPTRADGISSEIPLREDVQRPETPPWEDIQRPETPPLDLLAENSVLTAKNINPTLRKIGFLGLGKYGQGIVKNLRQSGHSLIIYDKIPENCKPFAELLDIEVAANPEDVVSVSSITFSCANNTDDAKFFVNGVKEELDYYKVLNKGYVELTSLDPTTSEMSSKEVALHGGRYLNALLLGTSMDARRSTLVIVASGDRSLYDECESCFEAISKKHRFIGENVANASKLMLTAQMYAKSAFACIAKALEEVKRQGLDQEEFVDIVNWSYDACTENDSETDAPQESGAQENTNGRLLLQDVLKLPSPLHTTTRRLYEYCTSFKIWRS